MTERQIQNLIDVFEGIRGALSFIGIAIMFDGCMYVIGHLH